MANAVATAHEIYALPATPLVRDFLGHWVKLSGVEQGPGIELPCTEEWREGRRLRLRIALKSVQLWPAAGAE